MRGQNVTITGSMVQAKAREFARQIVAAASNTSDPQIEKLKSFTASEGWLQNVKARLGIAKKSLHGEADSVDVGSSDVQLLLSTLNKIAAEYNSDNIFNADELGLQWRMCPSTTLAKKSVNSKGIKKLKCRITVLLGCNASGREKLKPLVIGMM